MAWGALAPAGRRRTSGGKSEHSGRNHLRRGCMAGCQGDGWGRIEELAQLVNEYIWEHREQRVELNANYIGKLERGIILWPGEVYREALRAVLNVSSDAALGLVNPRRRVVQRPVDRKQFLRGAALLGAGALSLPPVAALLKGNEPTPVPARVSEHDVEQIDTAARVFASWDHTYGGGLAREAVLAQLRWSTGLLDSNVSAKLRAPLLSAVGYLDAAHRARPRAGQDGPRRRDLDRGRRGRRPLRPP
jgi:hypothetical protein